MKNMQIKNSKLFFNEIFNRAREDDGFKNQLIMSPEKTLQVIFGKDFRFPENQNLKFEDQTNPDIIYLNIPRKIDLDDLELTDEQLKLVSGGDWGLALALIYFAGDAIYGAVDGYKAGMQK